MTEPNRTPRIGVRAWALLGLSIASIVACAGLYSERQDDTDSGEVTEVVVEERRAAPRAPRVPEALYPHVHARIPHDTAAFTQGLVYEAGRLFESTGLVGESSLRELEPATGRVLRRVEVAPPYFAEGLSLVGDELVQLTWQDHVAFVYGRDDFVRRRELHYDTEGWGLCPHGDELVMSDGSATLTIRDPRSFAARRTIEVRRNGVPVRFLNELECVGDDVYANVWQTNEIVRIELATGDVEATIDARGLLTAEQSREADVLNGIAYVPERRRFLVTGKLWPTIFEVTFEASP